MKQRYKKNICLFITILFFSVAAHGAAPITDAGAYLKERVVKARLSNGITVILLNRGSVPTLSFMTSFRVGSADEEYSTSGMAHMLEHMLFKGTETIGTRDYPKEKILLDKIEAVGEKLDRLRLSDPNSGLIPEFEKRLDELQVEHRRYVISTPYAQIYAQNGGIGFNAFTSKDRTAYVIDLPSDKLELWARLESERLLRPVMREFYLERGAVFEERLMRTDSSGPGMLYELFSATAFQAHPYRHPIIGWKSNIQFFSIKDLRKFYYNHYVPSKMTITIVGKQDTKKTLALLEKYFGKIKKRRPMPPIPVLEPAQNGERRFSVYFGSTPMLLIGWHKKTSPSHDDLVCDIIGGVLSDGKTARLYKALVLDKKICSSVFAWNGYPGSRYNNLFMIQAQPRHPYTPEQVEREIYAELDRLAADIKEEEIAKIVNQIESSMIFGLDSNSGIAGFLSHYQTIHNDCLYPIRYLADIKTIKPSHIRPVIEKYFTQNNRTVGYLLEQKSANKK